MSLLGVWNNVTGGNVETLKRGRLRYTALPLSRNESESVVDLNLSSHQRPPCFSKY